MSEPKKIDIKRVAKLMAKAKRKRAAMRKPRRIREGFLLREITI